MGGLDRGAVSYRIGEGNAQLEGVGAAYHSRADDLQGNLRGGISEHDEGNECALAGQGFKKVVVAAH